MRFSMGRSVALALWAGAGMAGAHLSGNSLKFNNQAAAGGESFAAGSKLTVGWQVATAHGSPINIDISPDGGTTWSPLKSGLNDAAGAATFEATLPSQATTHAKIRVCQGSASACANIKVSQPSSAPYTLVSGEFTITAPSAIRANPGNDYALGYDPVNGRVTASFELGQDNDVQLQAFDLQGRLQATLLAAPFRKGAHRVSLDAKSLASSEALVFKLSLGESIRTQAWTRM